ncbi:hypothetical protein PG984_010234, partial [Apiospora sp. TS-2023a]
LIFMPKAEESFTYKTSNFSADAVANPEHELGPYIKPSTAWDDICNRSNIATMAPPTRTRRMMWGPERGVGKPTYWSRLALSAFNDQPEISFWYPVRDLEASRNNGKVAYKDYSGTLSGL